MKYWLYQNDGHMTYWEAYRGSSWDSSDYTATIEDEDLGDYLSQIRRESDTKEIRVFRYETYENNMVVHDAVYGDKGEMCPTYYDSNEPFHKGCNACAALKSLKDSHWTTEYFEGVA